MNPVTGAIIPSAGKGHRMGYAEPKQFLKIDGLPVLAHTITRIIQIPSLRYLVIPASPELFDRTSEIVAECLKKANKTGEIEVEIVKGGKERVDSVRNALKYLEKKHCHLIMIHDAVRPCFPFDAVNKVLLTAMEKGAAVLAVPSKDTIKQAGSDGIVQKTLDRKKIWLVQTPQVFQKDLLLKAFHSFDGSLDDVTDDASLVEKAGFRVHIVPGGQENIKITYPSDLIHAKIWLNKED